MPGFNIEVNITNLYGRRFEVSYEFSGNGNCNITETNPGTIINSTGTYSFPEYTDDVKNFDCGCEVRIKFTDVDDPSVFFYSSPDGTENTFWTGDSKGCCEEENNVCATSAVFASTSIEPPSNDFLFQRTQFSAIGSTSGVQFVELVSSDQNGTGTEAQAVLYDTNNNTGTLSPNTTADYNTAGIQNLFFNDMSRNKLYSFAFNGTDYIIYDNEYNEVDRVASPLVNNNQANNTLVTINDNNDIVFVSLDFLNPGDNPVLKVFYVKNFDFSTLTLIAQTAQLGDTSPKFALFNCDDYYVVMFDEPFGGGTITTLTYEKSDMSQPGVIGGIVSDNSADTVLNRQLTQNTVLNGNGILLYNGSDHQIYRVNDTTKKVDFIRNVNLSTESGLDAFLPLGVGNGLIRNITQSFSGLNVIHVLYKQLSRTFFASFFYDESFFFRSDENCLLEIPERLFSLVAYDDNNLFSIAYDPDPNQYYHIQTGI